MRNGSIPKNTFLFLYAPVTKCIDKSKFVERIVVQHYLELWYSDARNMQLWLERIGESQSSNEQECAATNGVPPKGE
jgi:hypothetical protein